MAEGTSYGIVPFVLRFPHVPVTLNPVSGWATSDFHDQATDGCGVCPC